MSTLIASLVLLQTTLIKLSQSFSALKTQGIVKPKFIQILALLGSAFLCLGLYIALQYRQSIKSLFAETIPNLFKKKQSNRTLDDLIAKDSRSSVLNKFLNPVFSIAPLILGVFALAVASTTLLGLRVYKNLYLKDNTLKAFEQIKYAMAVAIVLGAIFIIIKKIIQLRRRKKFVTVYVPIANQSNEAKPIPRQMTNLD